MAFQQLPPEIIQSQIDQRAQRQAEAPRPLMDIPETAANLSGLDGALEDPTTHYTLEDDMQDLSSIKPANAMNPEFAPGGRLYKQGRVLRAMSRIFGSNFNH